MKKKVIVSFELIGEEAEIYLKMVKLFNTALKDEENYSQKELNRSFFIYGLNNLSEEVFKSMEKLGLFIKE